jgi:hypothetical protein
MKEIYKNFFKSEEFINAYHKELPDSYINRLDSKEISFEDACLFVYMKSLLKFLGNDYTIEQTIIDEGILTPYVSKWVAGKKYYVGDVVYYSIDGSDENIKTFAETVLQDINPRDSWRASRALRRHISVVMAERALRECITMAGGEVNG